jgi:hypothetical protein
MQSPGVQAFRLFTRDTHLLVCDFLIFFLPRFHALLERWNADAAGTGQNAKCKI